MILKRALGLPALGVSLLAVGTVGYLADRNAEDFGEAQRKVLYTNEVLSTTTAVLAGVRGAESAMRGFVLTGDDQFLAQYGEYRHLLAAGLDRLGELMGNAPGSQDRLARLRLRVGERLKLLEELGEIGRKSGLEAARSRIVSGKQLSGEIQDLVKAMEEEEARLRAERDGISRRMAGRTRLFFAFTTALAAALLVGLYFVSSRVLKARRQVEEELARFFEASLDLMGVASLQTGRFTRVSPSWEKLLGWTSPELTSRPWLDFVHPDDRPKTVAEAQKLAQGASVLAFENRYRAKDGSYRWLSWKTPAPAPGSNVLYAVARDITDLKRQEEEILRLNGDLERQVKEVEAANRELEAFTYSVSHDLRAPLRAIDGFSKIVEEDYCERLDAEGNRLVGVVRSNARQMGELIDDLLEFSRLGRRELSRAAVPMTELAQEAVDQVKGSEPNREVELRIDTLPGVEGDRAMLKQVWLNLVSNAFKYSRPRRTARIEIGARSEDGQTVYHVRDNGVGFDMRYVNKLFGVFQRLHARSEFEGTGVGLAIVAQVVRRHGGRVWAEGKVNEGSTFRFSIPRSQGEVAS